jgi:hypothetical protein
MKRGLVVTLAVAILSALTLAAAYSQEDMKVVESDAFTQPQRTSAVFRHDEHNEKAQIENCNQCHHVYADGKLVEDESSEDRRCSDCHGLQDSGRQPGLMKAFHLNCKGCHQETKKGPVMCGACHVRQ